MMTKNKQHNLLEIFIRRCDHRFAINESPCIRVGMRIIFFFISSSVALITNLKPLSTPLFHAVFPYSRSLI